MIPCVQMDKHGQVRVNGRQSVVEQPVMSPAGRQAKGETVPGESGLVVDAAIYDGEDVQVDVSWNTGEPLVITNDG